MQTTITHDQPTLGARIKWLREQFGLTLEEFGERIGFTKAYLSKLEREEACNPSQEFLAAIVTTFSVWGPWLTNGNGRPFLDGSDKIVIPPDEWTTDSVLELVAQTIRHGTPEALVETLYNITHGPTKFSAEFNLKWAGVIAEQLKKKLAPPKA